MINKFFLGLFLVFVPLQVKTLVFTRDVYDSGFFNPYLSHFVYLSDVFLLVALILCGFSLIFRKNPPAASLSGRQGMDMNLLILCALILFAVGLSIVFAVDQLNSWIYFLRLCELFVFSIFIATGYFSIKNLMYVFVGVTSLVALIGILQFIFQHSLGLSFFGEPELSQGVKGIASIDFFGRKLIRTYGTFGHPNIFAAYLGFSLIFIIFWWVGIKNNYFIVSLFVLCVVALVLTFSRTAFLGLLLVLLMNIFIGKFKNFRLKSLFKYFLVLVLVIFVGFVVFLNNSESSLSERLVLLDVSKNMFLENPFGVGIGNFTAVMQSFAENKLLPWNFQPVHNVYLLMLNEIGWFGLSVFLFLVAYLFRRFTKNKEYFLLSLLVFILFVSLFDHYLFSLYQGQFLFWLFIGLAYQYLHTFAGKSSSNVV